MFSIIIITAENVIDFQVTAYTLKAHVVATRSRVSPMIITHYPSV